MIGYLSPAIDLDQRNAIIDQQMLWLASLPQGIDRRMLAHPEFIGRLIRARCTEVLHGLPGGLVIDPPQLSNDEGVTHSTTLTIG